jgi:oxaloacetate decarboxylase alpha subunit
VRAAEHRLPAGLVATLDDRLGTYGLADRLDEVLDELARVRAECGWPPLVAPIMNIVGSQALLHVLASQRWQTVVDEIRHLLDGDYGQPPRPIDPVVKRAVDLLDALEPEDEIDLERLREDYRGRATSEEELLLVALFGDEAEALLRTIRARARGDETLETAGVDESRAGRIRELIDLVMESGIGEVTIEEGEMRVTVRRTEDRADVAALPLAPQPELEPQEQAGEPGPDNGVVKVASPMVGTFYRAPQPGAEPFVEVGDMVATGQTLCILEAMKLMNEVKAEIEAVVRAIHVENAQPVEYGQLLFELVPVEDRPLDAV